MNCDRVIINGTSGTICELPVLETLAIFVALCCVLYVVYYIYTRFPPPT